MTAEPVQETVCPSCGTSMTEGANFCGVCGTDLLPLQPNLDTHEGRTIGGRYLVGEEIGSGGMGEVYVAEHKQLGQKVAIKFLPRAMTGDERLVKRFFNEARNTGRVTHPNAVTLNDYGQTDDGVLYIIMEYIEGEDLAMITARKGRLDLATIAHILLQLCDVLHIAHKEGIVHRDLKPDNVMLTEGRGGRYSVKVLDFGIARLMGDTETAMTEKGLVYGTPEFMSPEQALGLDVDGRADLYSLAVMAYYLLCGGYIPFSDDDRRQILAQQVNTEPVRPSVKCPSYDIPRTIEDIVMKALSKEPDDRHESISVFADALEQAVSDLRDQGHFKDADPTFADMLSLSSQSMTTLSRPDSADTVPVSDLEQAAYMNSGDVAPANDSGGWSTGSALPKIGPSERFIMVSPAPDSEDALSLDFSGEMPSLARPKRRGGADPLVIAAVAMSIIGVLAVVAWFSWPRHTAATTEAADAAGRGVVAVIDASRPDASEVGLDAGVPRDVGRAATKGKAGKRRARKLPVAKRRPVRSREPAAAPRPPTRLK